MNLTNKQYDDLKFVAAILLPAIGALYFALAGIWGLPYSEQVVGTITAIDAFLGCIIQYAAKKYESSYTTELE